MKEIIDISNQVENVELQENNIFNDGVSFPDDEVKTKFINDLYNDISRAEDSKVQLLDKIDEWKKAINIEPDEETKMTPWENASNYRDFLTANHVNIINSIVSQTMITNPLWVVSLPFDDEYEKFLDDGLNFYAFNNLNIEEKLKSVIKLAIDETTSFMEIADKAEEKLITATQEFFSVAEFIKMYPNAEMLDMDKGEYNKLKYSIAETCDKMGSAKIELSRWRRDIDIECNTYNVDETCIIPWNSSSIDVARGVLFRIKLKDDDLKQFARDNFNGESYFDKDAVAACIKYGKSLYENTSYQDKKDDLLGTEETEIEDRNIFRGIYKYTIDEKIGAEEFYVYFAYNEKQLLRIERYKRINGKRGIIKFNLIPVHNSIIGESIPAKLNAAQKHTDTIWNMITDNNKLCNIPTFAVSTDEIGALNSSFRDLTVGLEFAPGTTLFLKNMGGFKQNNTTPMDTASSLNQILTIARNASTLTGATEMLSGRNDPSDPTAPGNKTAMQLNQANMRINEYIKSLRMSLSYLGELLLHKLTSLQPRDWGRYQVKFRNANEDTGNLVIFHPQEIMEKKVIIDVRAQSVEYNKTALAEEARMLIATVLAHPAFQGNPKAIEALYNKFLTYFSLSQKEIDSIMGDLRLMNMQASQNPQQGTPPPPVPPPPPGMVDASAIQQQEGK